MDISQQGLDLLKSLPNPIMGASVDLMSKLMGNEPSVSVLSPNQREQMKEDFKSRNNTSFMYNSVSDGAFVAGIINTFTGSSPVLSTVAGFVQGFAKGGLSEGFATAASAYATNKIIEATGSPHLAGLAMSALTLVGDHFFDKWEDDKAEKHIADRERYIDFSAADMLKTEQTFNQQMNAGLQQPQEPNTSEEVKQSMAIKMRH